MKQMGHFCLVTHLYLTLALFPDSRMYRIGIFTIWLEPDSGWIAESVRSGWNWNLSDIDVSRKTY